MQIKLLMVMIITFLLLSLTDCFSMTEKKKIPNLVIDQSIDIDGVNREYDLYHPSNLDLKRRYPLVISLHGHFGSKEYNDGRSGRKSPHRVFQEVGRREKFFIAYPQGLKGGDNHRGWNECRTDATSNPDSNDTGFIAKLMDVLIQNYPVDPQRIYVVGTSNGGGMAVRLAIEIPTKLAAVASIIFSSAAKSECPEPTHPIPILFLNGTLDPFAHYLGGTVGKDKSERGSVLSVNETLKKWIATNGSDTTPRIVQLPDRDTKDKSHVEVQYYENGKNHSEVVHYKIVGGGHVEPSIAEPMSRLYLRLVGPQNRDIETAEVIWDFFKKHKSGNPR